MNKTEYLLTTVSEECSETIKEASKCLRFGIHKCNPCDKNSKRNIDALKDELYDIRARAKMLFEYLGIEYKDDQIENYELRKDKLKNNMRKSENLGRLYIPGKNKS